MVATTTRKTPIRWRRGKPLPAIKHMDLVDWTSFPLHSKPNGRPIEVCPECGRKGQRSIYRSGGSHYVHLSRFETIFWMTRDSCTIGPIA